MAISDSGTTKYILQQGEPEDDGEKEAHVTLTEVKGEEEKEATNEESGLVMIESSQNVEETEPQQTENVEQLESIEENQTDVTHANTMEQVSDQIEQQPDEAAKPKPARVIDMDKPIALTSETVVVVDGKKCILRVDPKSNHLVAFPFKPEGTGIN